MHLNRPKRFDVLVIGCGIAGTMAAISAARAGARTAIACLGPLFSGSSFYPGTWGLGLIGPESPSDEADLADCILDVGCGMADPALVASFVGGISDGLAQLEALGMTLKKPARAQEREFIPCFDRKHRLWRGIERGPFEHAMAAELDRLNVTVLPRQELIDLAMQEGTATGAVLFDHAAQSFELVPAGAVVLATGGYGGLFERRLTADDVQGTAQAVALRSGCTLVNLEFMQMMPGLVHPKSGIVFNEKTFRFAQLFDAEGRDALREVPDARFALEARSGHGPFTARLASRDVDLALANAGSNGLTVRYRFDSSCQLPEFVRTYFDWLEKDCGIRIDDELVIAPYAHAANGGVLIDEHAATGVDGLYACGEATGGMHGADRIGGLSSANGIVFGLRAGVSAAAWAGKTGAQSSRQPHVRAAFEGIGIENGVDIRKALRRIMTEHCMIARSEHGLNAAQKALEDLAEQAESAKRRTEDPRQAAETARTLAQLTLARSIVKAARTRTESRGAHYRLDFPASDPHQARPLAIDLGKNGDPVARPLNRRR